MALLSEPKRLGDVVKFEDDMKLYSRDQIVLITGQNLLTGSVLGLITLGAVSQAFVGTGNGTLVMDVTTPLLALAEAGAYKVVFLSATTYRVFSPTGREIGEGSNGIAFANLIKFVTAAGATPFIAGDTFTVTIAAGSGKATAVAPAALDGSQNAKGVLIEDVNAAAADVGTTMVARFAIVSDNGLIWPAGISAPNKAAGVSQLIAAGILVRAGA